MPFMQGKGALRRTIPYLKSGAILLRDEIKIMTFGYCHPTQRNKTLHHKGLHGFIFWHLPQLQYKNPSVQMVTFKEMTPTPWIKAYFDDDTEMVIDCDSRSRIEIHDHLVAVLGKSKALLDKEKAKEQTLHNQANFGPDYAQQCICEVPGQVPCPGWQPLPTELTGKYRMKMKLEEETHIPPPKYTVL